MLLEGGDAFPARRDDPQVRDRVLVSWAALLRRRGRPDEALRVPDGHRGPRTGPEQALAPHDLGCGAAALDRLGSPPPASSFAKVRLYWHAAHISPTRAADELGTLSG